MRMWKVDPTLMCSQHLIGEHFEMHMFVGSIIKGISIRGYIEKGLVEKDCIRNRHDELANEMLRRRMKHNSIMTFESNERIGCVDIAKSLVELVSRCEKCRKLIEERRTDKACGTVRLTGELSSR